MAEAGSGMDEKQAARGSLLSLGAAAGRKSTSERGRSLLTVVGGRETETATAGRNHPAAPRAETDGRHAAKAEAAPAETIRPEAHHASLLEKVRQSFRRDRTEAEKQPRRPTKGLRSGTSETASQQPDHAPLPVRVPPPDNAYWQPLIDPLRVLDGILRSGRLIAAMTLAGAALGVLVALTTPKKYDSRTEILVDPRNLNLVERELTQSGLPSDATIAIVENQVRVLTSGTVLGKVVERLDLAEDPEFNGKMSGGISLRGMISMFRDLLTGADEADNAEVRRALAIDNLYEALDISRGEKTFVITITATTRDPEKSARIANTMSNVFLETFGELQSETASRANAELTSRLDELRKAVEEAERRVETFKAENELFDAQGRLISDDEIVALNERLSAARARTLDLKARAESAASIDVENALSGTLPEAVNSPVMTELRAQYASLRQQADRLEARLGPRHPDLLAMRAQLEGARQQIAQELRRIVMSLQVELQRAVQLERELAARFARLKVQHGDRNAALVTLRELERDAASRRSVYEAFLLRARETGEQQLINPANISVISRAHPALLPSGPSRVMTVIAGALLGFLAGVGLGAARGALASLHERRLEEEDRGLPATRAADRGDTRPSSESRSARPSDESRNPTETPMSGYRPIYPPYAHPHESGSPMHHHGWPQPPASPYATPAEGWTYPQGPASGPVHAAPTHGWPQPAAPHAHPGYYFAPQQPPQPGYWAHGPHPSHAQSFSHPPSHQRPHAAATAQYPSGRHPAEPQMTFEEIRDSLREFREALRELTEARRQRRYF
jgi:uncharacterized protein involved in exopolysaccharide biosynthesis